MGTSDRRPAIGEHRRVAIGHRGPSIHNPLLAVLLSPGDTMLDQLRCGQAAASGRCSPRPTSASALP